MPTPIGEGVLSEMILPLHSRRKESSTTTTYEEKRGEGRSSFLEELSTHSTEEKKREKERGYLHLRGEKKKKHPALTSGFRG